MSIDLQSFCYVGAEPTRSRPTRPFSIGDFTYATNGFVAIRVPRMADIGEADPDMPGVTPDVENVFNSFFYKTGLRDMIYGRLPECVIVMTPETSAECKTCNGGGECPHCGQECVECDGSGDIVVPARTQNSDDNKYVKVGDAFFSLKEIRRLQGLSGVKVKKNPHISEPMPFTFDGGDGLIMPANSSYFVDAHILGEIV